MTVVSLRPLVLLDGKDPTVIYLFLYIYSGCGRENAPLGSHMDKTHFLPQ